MMPVASCTPFPFSAPCNDTLAMLVCATRWLSMHLYTLAYMFMQESCLLVCHPCFNTMKLWTLDPNLHLSLADTTFVRFLAYLSYCLFACFLASLLAMPIMLVRFMLFHMLFASFPSITCLLVSYHCLCMYTHGAKTYRAKAQFPRRKQKRHGREHVEISQVGYLVDLGVYPILLGYVLFKTPSFLLPFSFRWVVLGISYCVPFILNSRVWRPLFIFLHLYFGPCSKDIGIYFPALCAYIVHDVCIYIYACSPLPV